MASISFHHSFSFLSVVMRLRFTFTTFALISFLLVPSFSMDFSMLQPYAVARSEDIPFIQCQVCEEIVEQLISQINSKRETIAPKKLGELEIINVAEKVCDLKRGEGEWIKFFDIVKQGDHLKLEKKDVEGECLTKCKTIQKACRQIMGDHDTDISELLFHEKSRSELSNLLCRQLSDACANKPPPLPKSWRPVEPFMTKQDRSAEMKNYMKDKGLKTSVAHNLDDYNTPEFERFKDKKDIKRENLHMDL